MSVYSVKTFKRQLNFISEEWLRQMVVGVLEQAPRYFWTSPASSTGKFHPPWALEPGGLVRHVKVVAEFAHILSEAWSLSSQSHDAAVSAGLLHDITKFGVSPRRSQLSSNSGWDIYRIHSLYGSLWAAEKMREQLGVKKVSSLDSLKMSMKMRKKIIMIDTIKLAILRHHGEKDAFKFEPPSDLVQKVVQTSDWLASTKGVSGIIIQAIKMRKVVLEEIKSG